MCSIEYLSNKTILTDNLHKIQFSLLELQKEYEKLLKNDAIENEKQIKSTDKKEKITEEEAKIRNKSIFDNLKTLEIKLQQSLQIKNNALIDLKKKYEDSIKDINTNNINLQVTDELDSIVQSKKEFKTNNSNLEVMNERNSIVKSNIIPYSYDNDSRIPNDNDKVKPVQSEITHIIENDLKTKPQISTEIIKINSKIPKIDTKRTTENPEIPNTKISENTKRDYVDLSSHDEPKIPSVNSQINENDHYIKSPVKSKLPKFASNMSPKKNANENLSSNSSYELNGRNAPIISPRVRDSRERMRSPVPPRKSTSSTEFSTTLNNEDEDKDSGKYYNEIQVEESLSNRNLNLNQYLKIFEVIHDKIKNGNYRKEYFEGVRKTEINRNESFSGIEDLLKSEYISLRAFTNVRLQDVVGFMLRWLPKMCNELNFDTSKLRDQSFQKLIERKSEVDFDELNTKISKALCTNNEIKKLWNQLNEHFDKLMQDKCLTNQDVANIFTSLLMPFSPTNNDKDRVSKLLCWLLTLMEAKYKTDTNNPESIQDIPVISDDDSITFSSITQPKEIKRRDSGNSYNAIKRTLAVNISEDDDPNDDINLLLTKSITKEENIKITQKDQSKNKLLNSMKDIDDVFISHYESQPKKINEKEKESDSDDFDFYK